MRRNERRKGLFLKKKQPKLPGQEAEKEATEKKAETKVSEDAKAAKEKPETNGSWNSELVEHDSMTVKLKLRKVNHQIPQFDGQADEVTTDAEVQTMKPEGKAAETQTKSPPELGYWSMNWSTFTAPVCAHVSATELPEPPKTNYMGSYRPPHHR